MINKIFLAGNIASGKSTLSKKLSRFWGLNRLDLDGIVYKDNEGNKFTEEETTKMLQKFLKQNKRWLIEGTQKRTWCEKFIEEADIVILLHVDKLTSLFRFMKRQFYAFFEGNHQKGNLLNKLKWIWFFQEEDLPEYLYLFRKHKKAYVILHNGREINTFLSKLVKRKEVIFPTPKHPKRL